MKDNFIKVIKMQVGQGGEAPETLIFFAKFDWEKVIFNKKCQLTLNKQEKLPLYLITPKFLGCRISF